MVTRHDQAVVVGPTAAEVDSAVAQQFLRVTGMLDSPATLLGSSFVARVRRNAAKSMRASRSRTLQYS